jgi:hypothetical protein
MIWLACSSMVKRLADGRDGSEEMADTCKFWNPALYANVDLVGCRRSDQPPLVISCGEHGQDTLRVVRMRQMRTR